jgi:hypothetical protein
MIQFTWHAYVIMEINGYLEAINDNKEVEHMKKNSCLSRCIRVNMYQNSCNYSLIFHTLK